MVSDCLYSRRIWVNVPYIDERPGFGQFRFVLGPSGNGVFGHVALYVQIVPEPGYCSVEWRVRSQGMAHDASERVQKEAIRLAEMYLSGKEIGLRIMILETTSDMTRRNDYERAVYWAFRTALEDVGLPVWPIFAISDQTDLPELDPS